jgi:hypothetical protein
MASAAQNEVRPRTAGEILDDAWRLYLANGPLLLALSSVFAAPLCITLFCLLTGPMPASVWQRLLWPALAAVAVLLSGLGSGACQEFFRRAADGAQPTLGECLGASLQRSGNHAAARGLIAAACFLGSWLLLLPGLAVLMSGATVHPILAGGDRSFFAAWRSAGQEAQRQPLKAAAVMVSRFALLLFAVLNLYLLARVGLWTAEHLAGLDVALAGLVLSLQNPAYLTALVMLAWLLLSPYFEAANYLLHVDARARYEGLDLWYRVQRLFPNAVRSRAGVLVLALGTMLLAPMGATGSDGRLGAIGNARRELQAVSLEISKAEPYPGSQRWHPRLQKVVADLEREAASGKGRYRWFHEAIKDFGHRGRDGALTVLSDLDRRLELIEESLGGSARDEKAPGRRLSSEELKKLLPAEEEANDQESRPVRKPRQPPHDKKMERRVEKEDPEADAPGRAGPRGPGMVGPHPEGGFGAFGWLILGGIFVATLVVATVQFWQRRQQQPAKPVTQQSGVAVPSLENILTNPHEFSVTGLWREADDLARAGRGREAVRTLYLAVLALLHRASLIRLERTRTNGEYLRQLRSRDTLHTPFAGMTNLFEIKWYSENTCEPTDYQACRALAEEIRDEVSSQ